MISCLRTEPPFLRVPFLSLGPPIPLPATRLSHAPIVDFPSSSWRDNSGANSQGQQARIVNKWKEKKKEDINVKTHVDSSPARAIVATYLSEDV